jgi:adenosylcobinamide-GDP ribazoletransferase
MILSNFESTSTKIDFDDPEQFRKYQQDLAKISRFFALVGLMLALICALIFIIAQSFLPLTISVALTLTAAILMSGALHEDGLADIFDGFWGGWSIERKLEIMKDSSIGVYGTLALICLVLLKYLCWLAIAEQHSVTHFVLSLTLAFTLSRALSFSITFALPYARKKDSKVGQLVTSPETIDVKYLSLTCLLPLLFIELQLSLILISTLLVCRYLLIKLFNHHLKGYTGDCLGAAQQISELVCYLTLIGYWSTVS